MPFAKFWKLNLSYLLCRERDVELLIMPSCWLYFRKMFFAQRQLLHFSFISHWRQQIPSSNFMGKCENQYYSQEFPGHGSLHRGFLSHCQKTWQFPVEWIHVEQYFLCRLHDWTAHCFISLKATIKFTAAETGTDQAFLWVIVLHSTQPTTTNNPQANMGTKTEKSRNLISCLG